MARPHDHHLHVCFFPMGFQGHIIPAIAMAKLFASQGLKATIIMTPCNAELHSKAIERVTSQNPRLEIRILSIELPWTVFGLPEWCQSPDSATSPDMAERFYRAAAKLDEPLENILREHRPDCLVADVFFPWAIDVAAKFEIPTLLFHGIGFFALCAWTSILTCEPHEKVGSDSEPFVIPNLPDEIRLTRKQVPSFVRRENANASELVKLCRQGNEAESRCFGVLVNSFYELEPDYADHYRRVLGRKAWHIGPLSLLISKLEGNGRSLTDRDSLSERVCLKWLDSKEPDSVVYVCFGTIANFTDKQLMEIAAALEASGKHFVWVVKKEKREDDEEEWLPEGFEKRMEEKGLIIRIWAPQVMILEHEAVGGFVTHCGWNSTLEGVCAGKPMVTWPISAEQFNNEKLVSQVLRIGVEVGAQKWEIGVGDFVKREAMEKAVRQVMDGEEAEEMRGRARVLAGMAKEAVEKGGSSSLDLNALIEELRLHSGG